MSLSRLGCDFVTSLLASPFRADQNTGGALLESPVRTAMQGKSRVSSVISVKLN